MNRFILVYICSLALAISSFAQAPTASPLASTPAATATISSTSTPASKIEQSIRKKQKKHFGFTIGDHDSDLDHGKSHDDIPEMVIPIVAIVFLTIFGAPVLIVGLILYFSFSRQRALHRTVRMMVEKGQPVPEALLNPPAAKRQRSDAPIRISAVFAAKRAFPRGFIGSPTIAFEKMRDAGRNWWESMKNDSKRNTILRLPILV